MYMEIRVSDFSSLLKIRFKKGTFPPPLLICTGWLRLLIICTVLQVMTGLLFGTLKWKQIVVLKHRINIGKPETRFSEYSCHTPFVY